jgi:hypothetical protein
VTDSDRASRALDWRKSGAGRGDRRWPRGGRLLAGAAVAQRHGAGRLLTFAWWRSTTASVSWKRSAGPANRASRQVHRYGKGLRAVGLDPTCADGVHAERLCKLAREGARFTAQHLRVLSVSGLAWVACNQPPMLHPSCKGRAELCPSFRVVRRDVVLIQDFAPRLMAASQGFRRGAHRHSPAWCDRFRQGAATGRGGKRSAARFRDERLLAEHRLGIALRMPPLLCS